MSTYPITIDCQYVYPKFAASYLIVEKDEAAFVETNTTHSVPLLLNSLKQQGLSPEQVKYVIITHVHLDHAGGSSALLKACPQAKLLAHPRAAVHMIRPEKLIQSATAVYGKETFDQLYGLIEPIEESRVLSIEDGANIFLGDRNLHFFHTRGHANHHFCIWDEKAKGVFTGDTFGLAYPILQKNGLFILPSTSPTDFDYNEAIKSIDKVLSFGPQVAYLTHFGEIKAMIEAADQLKLDLEESEKVRQEAAQFGKNEPQVKKYCEMKLENYYKNRLEKQGFGSDSLAWDYLKLDAKLNAAGVAFAALKSMR